MIRFGAIILILLWVIQFGLCLLSYLSSLVYYLSGDYLGFAICITFSILFIGGVIDDAKQIPSYFYQIIHNHFKHNYDDVTPIIYKYKEKQFMSNIIYLDEQLPPVNETVILVVVEVDHGESTDSKLEINYDYGGINEDGSWWLTNDWDEGQPWAIVGWLTEPKLPSEEEIREHKINWYNVSEK